MPNPRAMALSVSADEEVRRQVAPHTAHSSLARTQVTKNENGDMSTQIKKCPSWKTPRGQRCERTPGSENAGRRNDDDNPAAPPKWKKLISELLFFFYRSFFLSLSLSLSRVLRILFLLKLGQRYPTYSCPDFRAQTVPSLSCPDYSPCADGSAQVRK